MTGSRERGFSSGISLRAAGHGCPVFFWGGVGEFLFENSPRIELHSDTIPFFPGKFLRPGDNGVRDTQPDYFLDTPVQEPALGTILHPETWERLEVIMRGFSLSVLIFLVLMGAVLMGALAGAQPTSVLPGSVLLYPRYDSDLSSGTATLISATNTNSSRMVGPNNFRKGDVTLHYYYVDGYTCMVQNKTEFMTPNDLLVVLASDHNPMATQGYLLIVAEDPESGDAIQFNYLLGSSVFFNLSANKIWTLQAISFRGVMDEKNSPVRDRNGHIKTDALQNGGNANGSVDFDGKEYDSYPDELYIDNFLQEMCTIKGSFCLVSGLGKDFLLEVSFLIYDNEEDIFSASFKFSCWICLEFSDISRVVTNLGGTVKEIPAGWMRLNGVQAVHLITGKRWRNEVPNGTNFDPPFIGAFRERVINIDFQTGRLMHWSGTQNGNEFPADLEN